MSANPGMRQAAIEHLHIDGDHPVADGAGHDRPSGRLKNISVTTRLAGGFGFLLLLMLALATVSAVEFEKLAERMNQIVEVDNVQTALANDLLTAIDSMAIQSRTIALVVDLTTIDKEVKQFDRLLAEYRNAETALSGALGADRADDSRRKLLAEIADTGNKALAGIQKAVKQGAESSSVDATTTLNQVVRPIETVWRQKVAEFITLQKSRTVEAASAAQDSRRRALTIGAALPLSALLSGSLVAWWIILGIKRPIGRAIQVTERIAEGDLTTHVRIDSTDEIGRLLSAVSTMQGRLCLLVDQIRQSASSIQTASAEVASCNADLSCRTEQTASEFQTTASSMGQLTSMVRQSADAAVQANKLVSSTASVASRGGAMVAQVISTMNEINDSSRKIADIVGVIDGIASRTNILALNAAVESARAGAQGRGFAVVAGEVRSLAQRSAAAAREIKELIGSSVERVQAGSRLVAQTGTTMDEIVASVTTVLDTINKISAVACEQSSGIDDMNSAVSHLDKMTQQNTALVEEGAAAAESLKNQATHLTGMVSAFKIESVRA